MDKQQAVDELLAAHADMERLSEDLAEARERRRIAAQRLVELGARQTWIAEQLGVTPQAVDSFLKYRARKSI